MSSAASSLLFNQSSAAHHCESMSSPASSPQPVLCGKIFSHLSKTATHHLFGERNRPTTIHLVAQHNHLPTIYLLFFKRATYHTFGGVLFWHILSHILKWQASTFFSMEAVALALYHWERNNQSRASFKSVKVLNLITEKSQKKAKRGLKIQHGEDKCTFASDFIWIIFQDRAMYIVYCQE